MIQFSAAFYTLGVDAKAYAERAQKGAKGLVMTAAYRFMEAALKKIPTFNPPEGGVDSIFSTGFVAGAFGQIQQAIKLFSSKANLPTLEAPENIDAILASVAKSALKKIKETQKQRLYYQKVLKKAGEAEIVIPELLRQSGVGGPTTQEGLKKERQLYVRTAQRRYLRSTRQLTHAYIRTAVRDLERKIAAGKESPIPRKGPTDIPIKDILRTPRRVVYIGKGGRKIVIKINPYYYAPGGAKVLKTPKSGMQFATPTDKIFISSGPIFAFQFGIDVNYLTLQDIRNINRSKSAPWYAFKAGQEAAHKVLVSPNIKSVMPKMGDFIRVVSIIKVDKLKVSREITNLSPKDLGITYQKLETAGITPTPPPLDPILKKFMADLEGHGGDFPRRR